MGKNNAVTMKNKYYCEESQQLLTNLYESTFLKINKNK